MAISQLFCSTGPPCKRDSLWSWLVCACATMTWISSLGFLFSFGVFLPVFMDYLKSSRETAACLGSVAIALTFFTGHFSTALISRFGCRITTVIGGVFCAMGLIASSSVENIFVLFFTYSFLFAVGCSCTFSVGLVVLSHYFKKRQSLATGVLTSGHGGGVLILGPTLEALRTVTGWQATWRIMAGVALFTCSLSVTFDPNVETDGVKGNLRKRDSSEDRKDENIITKIKSVLDFSVWIEPPVIVFICCVCVVEFGHFVPQIHLIRFSEDLGFSPKRASQLLIYYGLCSAIGRLLAGFLCSHPRVNPFHVFQAAECIAGLSTVLVTLGTTYTKLIIYSVVYGLSDGFFFTTLSFLLHTVSPHKTAAVLGWEMMLTSLFLASGPALTGLLADKLGSYVVPFQLAGGITLTEALIPFTLLCFQRSRRATLGLPQDEGQPLLNELNHS